MLCVAEGCGEEATVPMRDGGAPWVCEKHLVGSRQWLCERRDRVLDVAKGLFASLVTTREHAAGEDVERIETLADIALDEAVVLLDRADARFR